MVPDKKRAEVERQRADAEAKLAARRKAEADEELEKFAALRKTRDVIGGAAKKAEEHEPVFDLDGVRKHLSTESHIAEFWAPPRNGSRRGISRPAPTRPPRPASSTN